LLSKHGRRNRPGLKTANPNPEWFLSTIDSIDIIDNKDKNRLSQWFSSIARERALRKGVRGKF
jgi:hypothetical protein